MSFHPFSKHEGVAAPMMRNDLEVEFIASPLNSTMTSHSLQDGSIDVHSHQVEPFSLSNNYKHAFAAERYLPDGSENPDFILNQPQYRNASILLMGKNFGIGSMQLMASIQLLQCGIKAIIASSFGPTFYEDSIAVGLLPIALEVRSLYQLQRATEKNPGSTIIIDLRNLSIHHRAIGAITIELDDSIRSLFLHGSRKIEVLNEYEGQAEKVIAERKLQRPWLE